MAPPATNPYAEFQQPAAGNPYADFQQPATTAPPPAPMGFFDHLQKAVDRAASPEPLEPGMPALPQRIASGMVRDVLQPLVHPVKTAESIATTNALSPFFDPSAAMRAIPGRETYEEGKKIGFGPAIERTLGGFGAQVGIGGGVEPVVSGAKAVAGVARDAALGDPNAAALRGLQIGPRSPKTLRTINAVEGSRPFLQGSSSLEDLQSRIPTAKNEIWKPYSDAIAAVGDKPVKGPDGITTVRALEDERSQLSALNRGLKSNLPEAVQLAQQKGMTAAELLDRERAVQAALDPELAKTGVDPLAIRRAFGQVSEVGGRVSGKSTLLEKPQPSGIGKLKNVQLDRPTSLFGEPLAGIRDLIAGRPPLSAKPTDLGIREGFRVAGPKPDLGRVMTTTQPPPPAALLGSGAIPLPPIAEVGGIPEGYRPPPVYADTDAMRLGRLLNAPPIELGGAVRQPSPMFYHDTVPMRTGRLLPAPEPELPLSSHHDIFPEQLPNASIVRFLKMSR